MRRNTLRWIIVAIMIIALVFTLSCPYIAQAEGVLPLDFLEGGKPLKGENWTFEGKLPVSYEDSTISVTFERDEITHILSSGSSQGKKVKDETWVVRIKIKDVSQLRTAVATDSYDGRGKADAAAIANSKNAVVAMNGDFFKYEYDVGYVVRQGQLIRDATANARGRIFDMLIIDSEGDFHVVYSATTEKIEAYVAENLTPLGRTILDSFNFGPVLILNGKVQDVSVSDPPSESACEAARQKTYDLAFPIQRICIVQTGHLEYAIVETGGKGGRKSGFTCQEFAEYVAEKCPGAILAYNLDGGGSASLIAWKSEKAGKGDMICRNPGHRNITDILYFASAED